MSHYKEKLLKCKIEAWRMTASVDTEYVDTKYVEQNTIIE